MDPDESLPGRIRPGSRTGGPNRQSFQPGVRYFMSAPVTQAHCRLVLREGYQRQRRAAAQYLCLLAPGTPLFPTAAPAWRRPDGSTHAHAEPT